MIKIWSSSVIIKIHALDFWEVPEPEAPPSSAFYHRILHPGILAVKRISSMHVVQQMWQFRPEGFFFIVKESRWKRKNFMKHLLRDAQSPAFLTSRKLLPLPSLIATLENRAINYSVELNNAGSWNRGPNLDWLCFDSELGRRFFALMNCLSFNSHLQSLVTSDWNWILHTKVFSKLHFSSDRI